MVDSFALLGLPRTAALLESSLHQAYTEHSRIAHPDHGGTEALAAQVNAAYDTLRHPEKRLKHLLEIAGPAEARAWRTVPLDDTMMSLFAELGKTLDVTGKFLERKSKTTSALARALLTNEELLHRDVLETLGFQIEKLRGDMEAQLSALDAALSKSAPDAWKQLATFQARFAYLAKWQTQVRERLLALM